MPSPDAVFIDTSVIQGQSFNLESAAMSAFVDAAVARKLAYLIVPPIQQEIDRHIDEACDKFARDIRAAAKVPILEDLAFLEQCKEVISPRATARRNLQAFLNRFSSVEVVGYENASIERIMDWYHAGDAPFDGARKKTEFPDAFAIDMLETFARSRKIVVAVVTQDEAFARGCERSPVLVCFDRLQSFVERLLENPNRVSVLRGAILADIVPLIVRVRDQAESMVYFHESGVYEVVSSEVVGVHVSDLRIVALGTSECSLVFECKVEFDHELAWQEWDVVLDDSILVKRQVLETADVYGSAKIRLNEPQTGIESITAFETDLDQYRVGETPFIDV